MKARATMVVLLVTGATLAYAGKQHATFRGRWFITPRDYVMTFTRCGARDKWLIDLDSSMLADTVGQEVDTAMVFIADTHDTATRDSSAKATLDSITASLLPPPLFVVVQGDTSPHGSYGPNGEYTHRLLVHDADSMPTSERDKCT